jgi:hypothetical protein
LFTVIHSKGFVKAAEIDPAINETPTLIYVSFSSKKVYVYLFLKKPIKYSYIVNYNTINDIYKTINGSAP